MAGRLFKTIKKFIF